MANAFQREKSFREVLKHRRQWKNEVRSFCFSLATTPPAPGRRHRCFGLYLVTPAEFVLAWALRTGWRESASPGPGLHLSLQTSWQRLRQVLFFFTNKLTFTAHINKPAGIAKRLFSYRCLVSYSSQHGVPIFPMDTKQKTVTPSDEAGVSGWLCLGFCWRMGTKPRVLIRLPLFLPSLANLHLLFRSYQGTRAFKTELILPSSSDSKLQWRAAMKYLEESGPKLIKSWSPQATSENELWALSGSVVPFLNVIWQGPS